MMVPTKSIHTEMRQLVYDRLRYFPMIALNVLMPAIFGFVATALGTSDKVISGDPDLTEDNATEVILLLCGVFLLLCIRRIPETKRSQREPS